jgi:hypothetical protein
MKPRQILRKILFVLLVLTSPHLVAQGNLVINGGFDTNATSWTLTNGALWAPGNGAGGYVVLSSGISNTPTASQTITSLTPDTVYVISGNYEASKGTSTENSFGVAINGNFLFETTEPGDFDWHNFDFLYTATSPSAVLSLTSQLNGTGISYDIDNIAMYAVPEPSPSLLLLLGSGVLFYVRRAFQR